MNAKYIDNVTKVHCRDHEDTMMRDWDCKVSTENHERGDGKEIETHRVYLDDSKVILEDGNRGGIIANYRGDAECRITSPGGRIELDCSD